MSDRQAWSRRLDEVSRHRLRGSLRTGCMLAGYAVALSVFGRSSFAQGCNTVSAVFTLAALALMFLAVWRRERAGHGPLGCWDQSIAFNGVAMLAHIVRALHGAG